MIEKKIRNILVCIGVILILLSPLKVLAGEHTVDNYEEYKKAIKKDISNQETNITMVYKGKCNEKDYRKKISHLYYEAEKELGGFEKQNRLKVCPKITKSSKILTKNTCSMVIEYEIIYKNSKEEVDELDKLIPSILKEITNEGMNEYEEVRAIYDFIIESYSYKKYSNGRDDIENLIKERNLLAGLNGQGVLCDAYAMLFSKMVTELGLENDMILGVKEDNSSHIWNIVKVDNYWYMVDSTFGDMDLEKRFKTYKELFGDNHTDEVYMKHSLEDVNAKKDEYFLISSEKHKKLYKWDTESYPPLDKTYNKKN